MDTRLQAFYTPGVVTALANSAVEGLWTSTTEKRLQVHMFLPQSSQFTMPN